jgi:nucleoside-diphosphate-sugar epimerase
VARALIVGCGCRGRELGGRLLAAGWQVRGSTRSPDLVGEIEAAGIEAAVADPDRAASVLDLIEDVSVVCWLLGSALGEPDAIAAIHGPRLERVMEELVDTPVRGFVYEAAGSVQRHHLKRGTEIVRRAADTWRIPVAVVDADPGDAAAWADAAEDAVLGLAS